MSRFGYKFKTKKFDRGRLLSEGIEDKALVILLIGGGNPALFIQTKVLETIDTDFDTDFVCLDAKIWRGWGYASCHEKYRHCVFTRGLINKTLSEVDDLIKLYNNSCIPTKHYTVIAWKDDNGKRTGPFGCGGDGTSAS